MRSSQSRSRGKSCWRHSLRTVTPSVSEGPGGADGAMIWPTSAFRASRPLAPARGDSASIVIRIPAPPERRKKLKALDARLQLVADLICASDQIVDLEQALFLLHVDVQ